MALTVGELVAYIRADGTQFDKQVDQSGAKFQGLGRVIGSGTQAIARSFAAVTTAGTALGVAVVKIGADYNRLQQSSRAALTTLLGSAEAANAQMDRLDEFARSSPFAKQVFITAQQQLLGFGVTAERVVPTLDAIQNAVAAVGGSNEQVASVTYALAQMQGQGKLTGETLNQLGQYGIDAATVLGEKFGLTGAEIREMASKPGGIPVEQVWDPLVEGLMDRFGGATANIKLQMDGAVDRIKGAWRDIGSVLAAPFIDPQGGGRAVEWANKVADALRALEQKAKPLVDLLVLRFKPGLDAITPALDQARGVINAWDLSKLNGQLDRLTKYTPLIAGVGTALFTMGAGSLPILSSLGLGGINPVVAGIAALVATSPELRGLGRDFLDALTPLLPTLGTLGFTIVDVAADLLTTLAPGLRAVLLAGVDLVNLLGREFIPVLVTLLRGLLPVAQAVSTVAEAVGSLPTPVLAAVAAFIALKALQGPLSTGFQSFRTVLQAVSERMALQTALAKANGVQLGTMGAAAAATRTAVSGLGLAMRTAFISSGIGLAIMAVTSAIAAFSAAQAEARQRTDDLRNSLDDVTGEFTTRTRDELYDIIQANGELMAAAERLGLTMEQLIDYALDPYGDALGQVGVEAAESQKAIQALGDAGLWDDGDIARMSSITEEFADQRTVVQELGREGTRLSEIQREYRERLQAVNGTTEENTDAAQSLTAALREQADAARDAAGYTMSQREAQIAYQDAVDRTREKVADGTAITRDSTGAVDLNSAATRRADEALLALVRASASWTDAMAKNNADAGLLADTVRLQRQEFINTAEQMGYNRQEAEDLADAYGLIPRSVVTELIAEAEEAQQTIERFITDNTGRKIKVTVEASGRVTYTTPNGSVFEHDGGIVEFYRHGGLRLNPMAAVAQMVPPNTWRVVGDRSDVPEAYIPLNGSARSLAILDEAASRLGRITLPAGALSPQAAGSVTGGQQPLHQRAGLTQQVTLYGIPADQPERFADELLFALRSLGRGSVYSREP